MKILYGRLTYFTVYLTSVLFAQEICDNACQNCDSQVLQQIRSLESLMKKYHDQNLQQQMELGKQKLVLEQQSELISQLEERLLKLEMKGMSSSATTREATSLYEEGTSPTSTTSEGTSPYKKDCKELYDSSEERDGVYTISPDGMTTFSAYCDMENGGWTVIQRRIDGFISFDRNWSEYANGFGNLSGEFWLGLKNIHLLTLEPSEILFTLTPISLTEDGTALYKNFSIEDEARMFEMHVSSEKSSYNQAIQKFRNFHGYEKFLYHNNMKFTTKDRDNDLSARHCSTERDDCGGYWFKSCYNFGCFNGAYDRMNMNAPNTNDIAKMNIKIRR